MTGISEPFRGDRHDLRASPAVPTHIGLMALGEAADRAAALAPIHPALIQRFCFLNASRPCLLSRTLSPHANVVFGASPKELFHHEPPSACSHQLAVVRSDPAAARVPPRPPLARSQCQPRVSPDSLALMAEHRDDLHVRHRRVPMSEREERFEEALQRLLHWSEVYSRDVFQNRIGRRRANCLRLATYPSK